MKRTATAVWQGSGKEGAGHLTTASTVLQQTQYSFRSRFEDGVGTNPEELIAAAHAGCFAMKLSFNLGGAGFTPEKLEVQCTVTLENGALTHSQLVLHARVPQIGQAQFDELVADAKANCPISKVLNLEIALDTTLDAN